MPFLKCCNPVANSRHRRRSKLPVAVPLEPAQRQVKIFMPGASGLGQSLVKRIDKDVSLFLGQTERRADLERMAEFARGAN